MTTFSIPVEQIADNPWQTRQAYNGLEELAADIKQNGLLQPPVVRLFLQGHQRYQLAFGHRRFRAYVLLNNTHAGAYSEFPVEIRDLTDEQMADFAWSENEQRRDVTPIERMHAIRKQMETFGWTQAQIADRRGLSEATVSNILRLGQLPEDVQDRVHKGELSERAALPLITYFNLPESVRNAAAKKSYIPNPVQYAKEGKASDDIRQAVNSVVQNMATSLKDIPLAQPFEGEAIITPTCQACANLLTYNQQPYCGEQTRHCYAAKNNLLEAQRREQASAESGLAFKGDERTATTFSYSDAPVLPFARERHCEHLRLHQPGYSVSESEALDPQRFPGIRIVCCSPNGSCACAQAMRDAQPKETYTPSPEILAQQQAAKERQAKEDALIETFNTHLSLPTQRDFLNLLTANDVMAWRLLLDKISNASWGAIEPLTLEQCQAQLADEVIAPSNWAILRDTDDTVARINFRRARLGLEPLAMPEPENATPAEKLIRRLERIESWMERWADGEEDVTFEAVEGNLANLEKIKQEYAAIPEAQREPGFFIRIGNHLDSLNAWLVQYDAEYGDDDEEEEVLEEAYA